MENQLTGKDPDSGKDGGQEKRGATEDEMVGWHHQLNGHEFEHRDHSPGIRTSVIITKAFLFATQ